MATRSVEEVYAMDQQRDGSPDRAVYSTDRRTSGQDKARFHSSRVRVCKEWRMFAITEFNLSYPDELVSGS